MFNKLFSLFQSNKNPTCILASVTTCIADIIDIYQTEFEKDHDAHIAAYDAAIQILESHKQKIIEAKNGQENPENKS
jgi:hypothetical protein